MARLDKDTWNKLKAEYIAGAGVRELAQKYNISHPAISKRIKKEEWRKLDNEMVTELIETKKVTKSYHDKVTKVTKEFDVKEEMLDLVIDKKAEIQIAIENNTIKLLQKQEQLLDKVASVQELEQHSKVVKNLNDTHFNKNDIKVENNIQNNQITKVEVEFVE